jgi:hypothetical protein
MVWNMDQLHARLINFRPLQASKYQFVQATIRFNAMQVYLLLLFQLNPLSFSCSFFWLTRPKSLAVYNDRNELIAGSEEKKPVEEFWVLERSLTHPTPQWKLVGKIQPLAIAASK